MAIKVETNAQSDEGAQFKTQSQAQAELMALLLEKIFLFQGLQTTDLAIALENHSLVLEKLYSSRPVYTAFRPGVSLEFLYAIVSGGPVISRSTPLDRVIAMTYPGGCFGMQNLAFSYGAISRGFPSMVEAYKTTDIIKIPLGAIEVLYENHASVRQRYGLLFELREKFQYHLLNCSTYPPQAVAALLRALVYQERSLGNQPQANGTFAFDLPIDLIARACQLNHRTVEQVLKGMLKVGLLEKVKGGDCDQIGRA